MDMDLFRAPEDRRSGADAWLALLQVRQIFGRQFGRQFRSSLSLP